MDHAGDRAMMIRPAAEDDLERLREIQAASPEASSWNPLDYDCLVALVEIPEDHSLRPRLATDPWDTQRAATEGSGFHIAGFLVSRRTAPDEREILNVAVDPLERRNGIGRNLIIAELSRSQGVWFLEVRESNQGAIALYRSMGFESAGRRPDYYDDPPEAAIVMRFFS
jgi:ribosomal protein S18 acetylase RimI-like enzyme